MTDRLPLAAGTVYALLDRRIAHGGRFALVLKEQPGRLVSRALTGRPC